MTHGGEPLGDRKAELGVLAQMLDAVETADRALILQVAGEPGIGKSRLLEELAEQAALRGHLVLSGRSAEFEAEQPFGVFGDALGGWLLAQERARLEALAAGLAVELAMVFPAFGPLASAGVQLQQEERYRAYRAVRGMVSSLARAAPVVVVLDDVQWADPGSVELIGHLLAHRCQGPVLLALAFRRTPASPRLSASLAAALKEPGTRRLELGPLSPAAARVLLGSRVSRAVGDRLYHESGGNPFYLLQLARGDARAGRRSEAGGAIDSGVPEAVRAALAGELSSLSAPGLLLLQGAAVAGDPFERSLAAAAAGLGAGEALDLADELLQCQLIHPAAVSGQFAFRHPIVRSTVYELASSGWRAGAHARIAATLAAGHATAAMQAPHVERSAEQGDGDAIAVLVDAAGSSARRAPALAARWYEAALRLLPESAATEQQRIGLLMALANAQSGCGRLERSRSALCEVLELLSPEHPGRVAVVAACAGVEHMLGRHRDAQARLTAAHRAQQDSRSLPAVLLALELAAGGGFYDRPQDMLRWAEQARQGAARLGEAVLEVAATGQVALAQYFLGLPASDTVTQAGDGLDALTDAQLAGRLDIGLYVGWSEAVLERHERVVQHCQRVIDVARASGQGGVLMTTMTAQAWALIRMGRLDEADETLAAATQAGYLAPHLFFSVALGLSSVLATHRADFDAAARAGAESVELARAAGPGAISALSGLFTATSLLEMGEPRRAREILLETNGGSDVRRMRTGAAAAYEVLARAELALERVDAAQAWADKAEAATHGWQQLGVEAAYARRAQAAVALARGKAADAASMAIDGARGADGAGAPVEAGRCRILAAQALAQAGRREDALAELHHAAEQLARVGAHGYLAQAEKALLRVRGRAGRRTVDSRVQVAGMRSLTDRERDVAELVGRGHTNREIATALFVSEKTVERDVSRIFTKLGVARRTELALRVAAEMPGSPAAPADPTED